MVCKHLCKIVDTFFANVFARDLLWWGSFERASCVVRNPRDAGDMSVASWNEDDLRFDVETCATSSSAQTMWMLNSSPAINVVVRMRLQILIPASNPNVQLQGESTHVQKIEARGHASVDVLAWRIMSVEGGHCGATLCLSATEFAHNNLRVGLVLAAPVMLTVHNVPLQKWNYRSLWIMRGVRRCMHCHQRWRSMQSVDVKHVAHRVLCMHCLDFLYARESQLGRRWRVRNRLPKDSVPRAHFVSCYMGAPTSIYPAKPESCVLKQDVAAFFKYSSWGEFIANNYKHSRPARRWSDRREMDDTLLFSSHWFSSSTA